MAETTYSYSLTDDFPGGEINSVNLTAEIQESSIVTALERIDVAGDDVGIVFKAALSAGDETTLDGIVGAHDATQLDEPQNVVIQDTEGNQVEISDNKLPVTPEPRVGTEAIYVTPNLCDECTWYEGSTRVTDEEATDSGDGLTWNLTADALIDMYHGRVHDEDGYVQDQKDDNPGSPHGYKIVVKVDTVEKTERTPFADSGGDYVVDYDNATITFSSSQAGNTVEVSYSKPNGFIYTIAPDNGYYIDIEKSEVQFSKNVEMNDTILFEIWAYNPEDLPNKMKVKEQIYKKTRDFIDEAEGTFPVVPAFGGAARGHSQEIYGFPFHYGTVKRLCSSQGAEIRVKIENDIVFGGELATATFYLTAKAE